MIPTTNDPPNRPKDRPEMIPDPKFSHTRPEMIPEELSEWNGMTFFFLRFSKMLELLEQNKLKNFDSNCLKC